MENSENVYLDSTPAQDITNQVIREKIETNKIISNIIWWVIEQKEKDKFIEEQFNELWLTREQVRNMSFSEHRKYAEQLHWKPMKVVWVAKPMNGWDASKCSDLKR